MKTIKMLLTAVIALMGFVVVSKVNAAQFRNLSLTMDETRPGETGVQTFRFEQVTGASLGRFTFQWCKEPSGANCTDTGTVVHTVNAAPTSISDTLGDEADWAVDGVTDQVIYLYKKAGHAAINAGTSLVLAFTGIGNGPLSTGCDATPYTDTCYVRIQAESNLASDQDSDPTMLATGWNMIDNGTVTYTIVNQVVVTAKVDPTFTFLVEGVNANTVSNGITSSEASSAVTLPFGNIQAGNVKYTMHRLTVGTNTTAGYTVTTKMAVQMKGVYDQNNIDPFNAPWTLPTAWVAPTGDTANDNTGWFGANTADHDMNDWSGTTTSLFAGVGTDPVTVSYKNRPDNGVPAVDGVYVTYALATNMYQPSDAYQGRIMYNAVPTY